MASRDEHNSIATSSRVTLDDLASEQLNGEPAEHDHAEPAEEEEQDEIEATDEEEDYEAYEQDRQRRIRENQLLLTSLGIAPPTPLSAENWIAAPSQSTARRKERKVKPHRRVYDRSGHVVSAPGPGERQRIACIELPVRRQLARRIQEGEYADCEEWWVGEERRWRFGQGDGVLVVGEALEVGGVTPDFRWRKWRGLDRELKKEMKQVMQSNKMDKAGVETPAAKSGEVSAYSLIPGDACHQCRRKSEKLKMRCRNVEPTCRAVFCETCCKRYSYFAFDPESRSFICPLCKDCCNCSNCIRKRKLDHLLGGKPGHKANSIEGMTVQAWLEQGIKDKANVPFERVRLVDQAFDFISPELPPEEKPVPVKPPAKKRKLKAEKTTGQTKAKRVKKGKSDGGNGAKASGETAGSLVLKLKVPKPVREKEVDSDGDTVGGYSDDEAKSNGSSLTSLSSLGEQLPIPPRFAFPPRPALVNDTNVYLATISPTHPHVPLTLASMAGHVAPPEILATSPVSPLTPGGTRPLPPSRESSVSSDGTRRRKKPPPKANIVRVPKHALSAPNTALPTGVSSQVQPTPMLPAMSFQSFSYDGYSSVPPPALPHFSPYASTYHHGLPPPYSHSPQSQQVELPLQDVYGPITHAPMYPPTVSSHHGPAANLPTPMPLPANLPTVPPAQDGLGNVLVHGQAMWMQPGDLLENGLTMERRYHPDFP